MADQFRADALGASGNQWIRAPNLDKLAHMGVRFSNAYSPQALCTPARAALLTGVYPHTDGLEGNLYDTVDAFSSRKRIASSVSTLPSPRGRANWRH